MRRLLSLLLSGLLCVASAGCGRAAVKRTTYRLSEADIHPESYQGMAVPLVDLNGIPLYDEQGVVIHADRLVYRAGEGLAVSLAVTNRAWQKLTIHCTRVSIDGLTCMVSCDSVLEPGEEGTAELLVHDSELALHGITHAAELRGTLQLQLSAQGAAPQQGTGDAPNVADLTESAPFSIVTGQERLDLDLSSQMETKVWSGSGVNVYLCGWMAGQNRLLFLIENTTGRAVYVEIQTAQELGGKTVPAFLESDLLPGTKRLLQYPLPGCADQLDAQLSVLDEGHGKGLGEPVDFTCILAGPTDI